MKFNELKLNKKIMDALDEMGFDEMMPIQEKSLNFILEGKDVVGQAQTGTGKTAAFVIPILEGLDENANCTEHLIMAPTRELAIQIVEEFRKIGKNFNIQILPIVGGMDIRRQRQALLKKPSIIVATPGRLIDHLGRKRIDLSKLKTFVIDEVDEMFKSGFKEEIDRIIKYLPKKKQTLLFSATISDNVKKVAKETCDDVVNVSVSTGMQTTKNIEQFGIILKENQKFKTLLSLLDHDQPKLGLVFGRTKRRADELGNALSKCGYRAGALHGDLSQSQRNAVMKKFKGGDLQLLVATDVAARGIDVNDITHIYNFDLPQEIEFYIHRIGRTGRAGKSGKAVSFIKDGELSHIDRIKKQTGSIIKIIESPTQKDVKEANKLKHIEKAKNLVSSTDVKANVELINSLLQSHTSEELASVVVDLMAAKRKHQEVSLTGEPPVKSRGGRSRDRDNRSGRSRGRGNSNYNRRDSRSGSNRNSFNRKSNNNPRRSGNRSRRDK